MAIAQVKITYKKSIDSNAETKFEKAVFKATYYQFLLKSRIYNVDNQYKTYTQILENDARAITLNDKLGLAVKYLLDQSNGKLPGLRDTLGRKISFVSQELELQESDLLDQSAHHLHLVYHTGNLILHQIIGEYLLLSVPLTQQDYKEQASTFMLKMQPDIAISSYQEYKTLAATDFTGFAAN
ncbi:MAG: hypothetical protein EOP42_11215 [Sphingobacteriaceae bacterium]|nr:MAG: hypothetical protein EOP42_11215 [Sphingobacteriaceae bacterium]